MTMASTENTLIVKHLPKALSLDERKELLLHFGAEQVKCMSDNGRMKYTAFATFPDKETAFFSLKKLHQLDVLGSKLSVEFSKSSLRKNHPSVLEDGKKISSKDNEEISDPKETGVKKDPPPLPEHVDSVNSRLGIHHPLNPKLKYLYPPPTVNILTNIANALAAVPKFYVQVLHLMNRMNLPAPFGVVTNTPPMAPDVHVDNTVADYFGADNVEEEEMVMSSTEESELESDGEDVKIKPLLPVSVKRQKKQTGRKKLKLRKVTEAPKIHVNLPFKPSDVFEPVDGQGNRKIEFNLRPTLTRVPDEGPLRGMSQWGVLPQYHDLLEMVENVPTVGGFGKIEPANLSRVKQGEDSASETEEMSEFISSGELRRNRLSEREMRDYSVFKYYDPGESSSRLYIKNLHRHVTEKDLKYIYGRYVDWSNETEVNMFDVRLMTEGRMKGQAFVTLGSEKIAARALKRTNAYLLRDKPIVVNFARSAKAKEPNEEAPKTIDGKSSLPHSYDSNRHDRNERKGDRSMTFQRQEKYAAVGSERGKELPRHSSSSYDRNRDGDRKGESNSRSNSRPKVTSSNHLSWEVTPGQSTSQSTSGLKVTSSNPLSREVTHGQSISRSTSGLKVTSSNPLSREVTPGQSTSQSPSGLKVTSSYPLSREVTSGEKDVNSGHKISSTKDHMSTGSLSLITNRNAPELSSIIPAKNVLDSPSEKSDLSTITCGQATKHDVTVPRLLEEPGTPTHFDTFSVTPPHIVEDDAKLLEAESDVEDGSFISKGMLAANRLSESERLDCKVFKNYKQGEPSCKLYVKNLNHKLVTEEDILYIFGRFVKGEGDVSSALDIKLLKEGRMKGQAFITFRTVQEAQEALSMVNGYNLHDKPMVIQFGRS